MTTHNAGNERIKRRYFTYLKEAKRHSEPTVDAVAKALARFESDTRTTITIQPAVRFFVDIAGATAPQLSESPVAR